jgi:hypothetical protein
MEGKAMVPRRELQELLQNRLKAVLAQQEFRDLLTEIDRLEDDWEEMNVAHREMGYSMSVNCPDICWLADQVYNGAKIKLYRRRKTA